LIREERKANLHEDLLFKIAEFQNLVEKDMSWKEKEREQLVRFLGIQATSWGLMGEPTSQKVRKMKEDVMSATWRIYSEKIGSGQETGQATEQGQDKAGLETKLATSEPTEEGDTKPLSEDVETEDPVSQTVENQNQPSEGDTTKNVEKTELTQ
jgi:hypothetical protein